jgi:hypothetical protein
MIRDREDERLMDYYVMLQSHIVVADKAGLLVMLLILAKVEEMVQPLPNWEARAWREQQSGAHTTERAISLADFVDKKCWSTPQTRLRPASGWCFRNRSLCICKGCRGHLPWRA